MIPMTLQQAADHTGGSVLGLGQNNKIQFSAVTTDSRKSMLGSLFIALHGDNFNGHEFIDQAKDQGAVACMLDESRVTALPVLKVDNTSKAMAQLAQSVRNKLSMPCIGITGSCGKTTVKEMLANILAIKGKVLATKGNFNNAIGVPLTLFRLTADDQYAVIEMGASKSGDIDEIAQLVAPDVAVITNVSAAHLQGLGSIEGVANVKGELLDHLHQTGTAILEYASPWLADWTSRLAGSQQHLTFSRLDPSADYYASEITLNEQGQPQFIANTPEGAIQIQLPMSGTHNVDNALAAIAAAIVVGVSLSDCQHGLAGMSAVKGRLQILSGLKGCRIIDDSYNANPASLLVAMEMLNLLSGKHLLVLGDMAELGEKAESAHLEAGKLAKKIGIDGLFATGELSRFAVDGFGDGARHFATKALLAEALTEKISERNTGHWNLLIKGSRSAQMNELVTYLQDDLHGKGG